MPEGHPPHCRGYRWPTGSSGQPTRALAAIARKQRRVVRHHPCPATPGHAVSGTQKKYSEYGLEPYVAHATFQYSGTPGKRHRFREAMLFADPPEYYDHPKGFVAIE